MGIRILNSQPLRDRGVIEGLVGRNQGDGGGAFLPMVAAGFDRHGELHGIVGSQCVSSAQALGLLQHGGRDPNDCIPPGKMLIEAAEDRRRLGGGDRLALRRRTTAQVTSTAVI